MVKNYDTSVSGLTVSKELKPDEGLHDEIYKIIRQDIVGHTTTEKRVKEILSKAQAHCEKRVREERERLIPIVCTTVCKFMVKSDEKIECGRPDCPLEFFLNKNDEALKGKGEG